MTSSPIIYAKGLNQLTPATPEEKMDEAPKNDQTTDDTEKTDQPVVAEKTAPEAPKIKSKLKDKVELATSFGWINTSKEGNDWRSSGVSDFTVSYKVDKVKIKSQPIMATFRYAPVEVAPQIEKDGEKQEYKGVIEGYHFGASHRYPLKKKLAVISSAELGLLNTSLKGQFAASDSPPDDFGAQLSIGGGADWQLLEGFFLGPKLIVGVGTHTSIQLSGLASFAF